MWAIDDGMLLGGLGDWKRVAGHCIDTKNDTLWYSMSWQMWWISRFLVERDDRRAVINCYFDTD